MSFKQTVIDTILAISAHALGIEPEEDPYVNMSCNAYYEDYLYREAKKNMEEIYAQQRRREEERKREEKEREEKERKEKSNALNKYIMDKYLYFN